MNRILSFLSILGALSLCIKSYFAGNMQLEVAAAILIFCAFIAASDKLFWQFVKTGIAIFSFGYLLVGYAYNFNDFMSLIQPILTLLIALFGFFMIGRVFFGSSGSDDEVHFTVNKKTGRLKKKNSWW